MRPTRLEMEGFGSFRTRTVIDFGDADLFVFSGPTGSGKSTIIDGITFALYGAVPRYQRSNLVMPAISNGKEEARVCLDFEVAGKAYTAIRVVRRTKTGASTREARLVCEEEAVAGDAPEVTAAVERLLGLSFEHFQKCVVLPQGAFAQLLHDGQSNRLALLRSLLDIEAFSRMRVLASGREQRARHEWDVLEGRLGNELAGATEEALERECSRIATLGQLVEALRGEAEELARLAEKGRRLREAANAAEAAASSLVAIRLPADIAEIAGESERLRQRLAECERTATGAEAALQEAQTVRKGLPERDAIERLLRSYDEIASMVAEEGELQARQDELTGVVAIRAAELERAEETFEAAQAVREAVFRENHAAAAARGLQAGDLCPVCGEVLTAVPPIHEPADMKDAEARKNQAEGARNTAVKTEQEARNRLGSCVQELERLAGRRRELEASLAGQPGQTDAAETRAAILEAEEVLTGAQQAWSATQGDVKSAHEAAASARARQGQALMELDTARDSVAASSPPTLNREDLAGAWQALVGWAAGEAGRQQEEAAVRSGEARDIEAEREGLIEDQRRRCMQAEVAADEGAPLEAATVALARAEDSARRIEEQLSTAKDLRERQAALAADEQVAKALARHLRAERTGFEAWYVRHIVEFLTTSASETLKALSQGQFSLGLAENDDFEVIDHGNADARRHIRTLSGGETFLASLALALALADSIATVAAGRTARLEAIFLDEGFGTLDPETLDVVATAIEELSAGGRMVGLVTHVSELAARMPVRFEVRRGPTGSSVERVEA